MKVKDLIDQLNRIDRDLEVLCYSEDTELLPTGHGFRLFEIEEVRDIQGEKIRGDDHVPSLKIGSGPQSQKHAIIQITSDF